MEISFCGEKRGRGDIALRMPRRENRLLWVYLLFLTLVAVGFFLPVSRSLWWGVLLKGILFLVVLLLLYHYLLTPSGIQFSVRREDQRDREVSAEEMGVERVFGEEAWCGFGEAFRRFCREFATVVRTAVVGSCVGLYLRRSGGELELQAGENDRSQTDRRTVVPEGCLEDHVAKHRAPLLEGNLPIGTVLAGVAGSEIRSFLGVPLIVEDRVVGVLAVGSDATESFGETDREFLIRCGGVITQVMAGYHRGLQWEMDQEVYRIHLELEKILGKTEDEESAVFGFVEHIQKVLPFDRFTLCVREGDEGIIRYVYGQIDDLDRGVRFSLDDGLNGWILKRHAPLLISDMSEGDCVRPRCYRDENPKHGLRSFLGISLGRGERAWGCLSLESRVVGEYGEKEKEVLTTLAVHLEFTLELLLLLKQLRELGTDGMSFQPARFQME